MFHQIYKPPNLEIAHFYLPQSASRRVALSVETTG